LSRTKEMLGRIITLKASPVAYCFMAIMLLIISAVSQGDLTKLTLSVVFPLFVLIAILGGFIGIVSDFDKIVYGVITIAITPISLSLTVVLFAALYLLAQCDLTTITPPIMFVIFSMVMLFGVFIGVLLIAKDDICTAIGESL